MELVEKILNEKFADFQQYHTIVLLIITAVLALLQIFINYRLTAKLKKAEIKFSRHHNDQIQTYKLLYERVYEFWTSTRRLTNFDNRHASLGSYQLRLNNWLDELGKLGQFFSRNKILFSKETCILMDDNLKLFLELHSIITKDKYDLEDFAEWHDFDVMRMYGDPYVEADEIQARAKKLKESEKFKIAEINVPDLLSKIEIQYRSLVK